MAYGMKLMDSVGGLTYDTSSQAGVFVEFATLPERTTTTEYNISYPSLVGRNIYVIPIKAGNHFYTIYGPTDIVPGYTSAIGYPVIRYKWSGYSYTTLQWWTELVETILMVFTV